MTPHPEPPLRRQSPAYVLFFVAGPIGLGALVVLCVLSQVYAYLSPKDVKEPGGYLDQANALLGIDDACTSFRGPELAALSGIDAEPSRIYESSPTEYIEPDVMLDKVSCRLIYAQVDCSPEQAGANEAGAFISIDLYPNPSEALVVEGYEIFMNDYGGEEDLFDTHFASLGAPWREGELFTSENLPELAIAAIAVDDFYRIEVEVKIGNLTCAPSEQEIATLLSDEYLPGLHASIEERAEGA